MIDVKPKQLHIVQNEVVKKGIAKPRKGGTKGEKFDEHGVKIRVREASEGSRRAAGTTQLKDGEPPEEDNEN